MQNNMNDELDRLFLLELLVDNVTYEYAKINLPKDCLNELKQTCIRFQFLDYPVLDICEDAFCPNEDDYKSEEVPFKNGKSCLFSLPNVHYGPDSFNVSVRVLRLRDHKPPALIGKTCIQLGQSFTDVLSAPDSETDNTRITKTTSDSYTFCDDRGVTVGCISVFIRLSCFGKIIVTQFQIGGDENNSFLFKGVNECTDTSSPAGLGKVNGSGDKSQTAKPIPKRVSAGNRVQVPQKQLSAQTSGCGKAPPPDCRSLTQLKNPCASGLLGGADAFAPGGNAGVMQEGMAAGWMQGGMMPGGMQGGMMPGGMQGGMMPSSMQGGMMPGGMQGGMMPGGMQGGMMPGGMQGGMGWPMTPEIDESKLYKEIGAEVSGHEIKIRILRKVGKPRRDNEDYDDDMCCGRVPLPRAESSSSEEDSSPPMQWNLCDCDYPAPPAFGMPRQQPKKKKKKKKKKCPLESVGNYCMKSNF